MARKDVSDQNRSNDPASRGEEESTGYRPSVVVKFHDYVDLPYEDGVEAYIQRLRMVSWERLIDQFPGVTFRRLYTAIQPEEIQALVAQASELDQTYSPPNLLTYFVVDCPPGADPERLAEELSAWQIVQSAYVGSGPAPPPNPVNPADDPRFRGQGYLKKAPNGIDAEFAWGFAGGDGNGIQFIDIERGWMLNHEDLAAANITLISGVNNDFRDHGTAVLGEVVAVDNTTGGIGIAPGASARVASVWKTATQFNTSDAILSAINALKFGDVLLLETQTKGLRPIETDLAVFDAIRLGTALGIVIVEPAGNGGFQLESYKDFTGKYVLDRTSPDYKESGAIMVGSASSAYPHVERKDSNYGNRVDCYAWGDNVDTCWTDNRGMSSTYTSTFAGTSSASAIIAGAALVVQGIAEAKLKRRFSPWQMRAILSDENLGTPAYPRPPATPPAPSGIGVMPDLKAIITKYLNLAPDVYIRDFVGDKGDPHMGAVSTSPDIILRQTKETYPQKTFGEGSGTENSNTLGHEAKMGQNSYIYVRVSNRGGSPAKDVLATVFVAEVTTLLSPWLWSELGSVKIPNVPAGDLLTVSDPITWMVNVPKPGHYCFIGIVGNEQDPAPKPPKSVDWKDFLRLIRDNNNIAWRNFNIVPNTPKSPSGFVELPFLAAGALEIAMRFQLDVVARLPEASEVWLEMPLYLVDAMEMRSPYLKLDDGRNVAGVPINPHGHNLFGEALFPAETTVELRLLVNIPEEARRNKYELYVSQLYEGEEVGRVTWQLVPEERGN